MAFELPDLPYPHDALAASGMSRETLEFHHDIHHKAYVDNGNKLIAGTEWLEATTLRNDVLVSGATITVRKPDGATTQYTKTGTFTAGADVLTQLD